MRRTWLRGRENIHKRYLIHVAGHNLGLLMRSSGIAAVSSVISGRRVSPRARCSRVRLRGRASARQGPCHGPGRRRQLAGQRAITSSPLARPAAARATWQPRLAMRSSRKATGWCSPELRISSSGCRRHARTSRWPTTSPGSTSSILLILDDLSYVQKDQAETSVLFELIATRYERRSIMITANRPFGALHRVAHALRGTPANSKFGPDIVERQPARALQAYRELDDVGEPLVPYCLHSSSRSGVYHKRCRTRGGSGASGMRGDYGRKPIGRRRSSFASHSSRSMAASALGSSRHRRISAFFRTTAKSPGVSVAISNISGGASIPK